MHLSLLPIASQVCAAKCSAEVVKVQYCLDVSSLFLQVKTHPTRSVLFLREATKYNVNEAAVSSCKLQERTPFFLSACLPDAARRVELIEAALVMEREGGAKGSSSPSESIDAGEQNGTLTQQFQCQIHYTVL